jgi:hypothetical protein
MMASMRSSTSERPDSASAEASQESLRRSAPGPRGQLITLIGVAPAAPIVTGRPTSPSIRPVETDALPNELAESLEAPASRMRPRSEPRAEKAPVTPHAKPSPSQTFDAISVGERPAAPHARSRVLFLAAVAALGVVGLGVAGTRAYGTARASAAPSLSVIAPLDEPANKPSEQAAVAAPAAITEPARQGSSVTEPARQGSSVTEPARQGSPGVDVTAPATAPEPPKKHAKAPVHRKHAPAHTVH